MECFDPFRDYFDLRQSLSCRDGIEQRPVLGRKADARTSQGCDACFEDDTLMLHLPGYGRNADVVHTPDTIDDSPFSSLSISSPPGSSPLPAAPDNYPLSPIHVSSVAGSFAKEALPQSLPLPIPKPARTDYWMDLSAEIGHSRVRSTGPAQWETASKASYPVSGHSSVEDHGSTGFYSSLDSDSHASISPDKGAYSSMYPPYSNGCNQSNSRLDHLPNSFRTFVKQIVKESVVSSTASGSYGARNGNSSYRSLDDGKFCVFCKNNKERREFYTTHVLKDSWGKVICPILRKYVCPICAATGDKAHTIRHCPVHKINMNK